MAANAFHSSRLQDDAAFSAWKKQAWTGRSTQQPVWRPALQLRVSWGGEER
jgi:hypothetical protein